MLMTVLSCDILSPLAPDRVGFASLETGGVELSWSDSPSSGDSFHIEADRGEGFINVGSVPGSKTNWKDVNIADGDSVVYRIRAVASGAYALSANFLYTHAAPPPPSNLMWEEDFSSGSLNEDVWTYESGHGVDGWGNLELQDYRKENAWIEREIEGSADGTTLIIEARRNGDAYTSSRIKTQGKVSFESGRIEARMKLPEGQGIWPAFWMLGENIASAGWPSCGEIDIMEMVGGTSDRNKTVHGAMHWDSNGHVYKGGKKIYYKKLSEDFHVYGIDWNENDISWYFDGVLYHRESLSSEDKSELKGKEYFLILNLAVGGRWPGYPDSSTVFPQRLYVDWIRVYEL